MGNPCDIATNITRIQYYVIIESLYLGVSGGSEGVLSLLHDAVWLNEIYQKLLQEVEEPQTAYFVSIVWVPVMADSVQVWDVKRYPVNSVINIYRP